MYLLDGGSGGKGKTMKYYDCGYCGARRNETNNNKGEIIHQSWGSPNDKNFEYFKSVLEMFADMISDDTREMKNFKEKISKASTYLDVTNILKSSRLPNDEKKIEIIKSYCLKLLEDNLNYGPKTKFILKEILNGKEPMSEKCRRIILYVSMHRVDE